MAKPPQSIALSDHQPYLDRLSKKIKEAGLSDRVAIRCMRCSWMARGHLGETAAKKTPGTLGVPGVRAFARDCSV